MSLQLLLDEDSQAKQLVNLLKEAGHNVITVKESNLMSKPDSIVLDFARQQKRILLTRNCDDFHNLHNSNPQHPGILAVYQHPDFSKNMSYQQIIQAITNIQTAGIPIENQFIVLNQWHY